MANMLLRLPLEMLQVHLHLGLGAVSHRYCKLGREDIAFSSEEEGLTVGGGLSKSSGWQMSIHNHATVSIGLPYDGLQISYIKTRSRTGRNSQSSSPFRAISPLGCGQFSQVPVPSPATARPESQSWRCPGGALAWRSWSLGKLRQMTVNGWARREMKRRS